MIYMLRRKIASLAGTLLFLGATTAMAEDVPVEPTDSGNSVMALAYARAFTLDEPLTYDWSAEALVLDSGYVLVFEVDPEYAYQRQVGQPVLYVGARPAAIVNHGHESGIVVAIVPDTDLAAVPAFYGSVMLPEQVDAERGAAELAAARAVGVENLGVETVARALAEGGPSLEVATPDDLYRSLADVIEVYSPTEEGLVSDLRLIPESR
jgi:hypothetical protein